MERPKGRLPNREPKPNSPVLRSYTGNDGPCSPYRQPVSFLRDQLNRNKRQEEEQGKYIRRMNVFRNRQTRPVKKEEYDRLMVKTYFKGKEEVSKDIVIPRWPESERHIPGGVTLRPESPRMNTDYDEDEYPDDGEYYADMIDFHGDYCDNGNRTSAQHETPNTIHSYLTMQTQREINAQFDRLVNADGSIMVTDRKNLHSGILPQLLEVSQDEIERFSLNDADVSRIAMIRQKLASTLNQARIEQNVIDGGNNKLLASPRKQRDFQEPLDHFSPPADKSTPSCSNNHQWVVSIGDIASQHQHYSPAEQQMFQYASGKKNPIKSIFIS